MEASTPREPSQEHTRSPRPRPIRRPRARRLPISAPTPARTRSTTTTCAPVRTFRDCPFPANGQRRGLRQARQPPAGRHRVCVAAVRGERLRPGSGCAQHRLRRNRARQRLRLRRRRHRADAALEGQLHRCGTRHHDRPGRRYRRMLRHRSRDRHHGHARDRSSTNTLFVVAATKEVVGGSTTYPIRLHALDLSTGVEKFGGPVAIQATVAGTGQGRVAGSCPSSGCARISTPGFCC